MLLHKLCVLSLDIHIDAAVFHGILKGVVVKVFQNTPEPPAVGLNEKLILRCVGDNFQVAEGKFFFKFTVGLVNHFGEINQAHIQC